MTGNHAGTWIGWAEFFLYGDVEDTSRDAELLMDSSRFQGSNLNNSCLAADVPMLLKPAPQVEFDLAGIDFGHLHRTECRYEGLERALVRLVRLGRSIRRLGIVLQEKVRPIVEYELFAFANNIQRIVIPGPNPLTQLPLCFLPILSLG